MTITDLIKAYFMDHPHQDLRHGPVVDYVEEEYLKIRGRKPRDPWRNIRRLHEQGFLIKVQNGVYRYDPDAATDQPLEDFTPQQKREILERDEYKCVTCGYGEKEGVTLHVDHIRPRSLGGRATIENGQTLCARHNFYKKNFNQTEAGKKMFIRLYEAAKADGESEIMEFCLDVLNLYDKHDINGHIEWEC